MFGKFVLGRVLIACAVVAAPSSSIAAPAAPPERVVFGGDINYPPFEWDSDGTPQGFNIDLEDAMGAMAGISVEHRLADWPDTVRALETGAVDVVPMFESDVRKQRFLFAPAFFYVNHAIYGRPSTESISDVSNLSGRSIVIEESSYAHNKIKHELPGVKPVVEANTLAALRALAEGRADYAILAMLSADRLIRLHDIEVHRAGPLLWPTPYAFAVRKDNVHLHEWLTQVQALLFASGRYETVLQRWEPKLVPGATTVGEVAGIIAVVLTGLFAVGLAGFLWSWHLRRAVAARTRLLHQELKRREAVEAEILYISNYDVHTDLPRLHYFLELVDHSFSAVNKDVNLTGKREEQADEATPKEVAVVKLADLDKVIRTFGHGTSNEVLRKFAHQLKNLRFDVCGYLGREVFAVLGDKGVLADRADQITSPFKVRELEFHPRVTWGIAHWPEHGGKAADLIQHAETALAAASVSHNRVGAIYHPVLEPNPEDIQLLSDFSRSRGDQLYAVFQPQVDLHSGLITAAEALVRWDHPRLGHISPGRFIPLVESSGLAGLVTGRMLDRAAQVASDLRRGGFLCPISVNVTVHDLLETSFIETIFAALRRHNAVAGDIKLELTETSSFENAEHFQNILSELSRLGIETTVDDYGTGYSSMSYLSAFPVREVKIDVGFVRDMLRNPRHRSLVRSTIAMVHELGMIVVAEGAEDEATIRALRDDGCDRTQGFAISKPLAAEDFKAFLARYEVPEWLRAN